MRKSRTTAGLFAVLPSACFLILAGCCASRGHTLRADTRDSLITEKKVEHTEKLRDTVIYITLPVESYENEVKRDSSFLQTSLAFSTAAILPDGSLRHLLKNKPGPVAAGVSLPEKHTVILTTERSANHSVTEVPVKEQPSGMERFLICSGILLWGAVAGALAVFLIRLFR